MTDSSPTPNQLLQECGAIIHNSHIVYTSGRHGRSYVNKDAVYPHTRLTSKLCREMAKLFADKDVEIVVAPAVGGIILSQWVAHHLSEITDREVLGIYAEKTTEEGEGFIIRRGYDALLRDRRALIVEDIVTTGISVKRVVETVRKLAREIVGVSALCNRGGISAAELGVPALKSLMQIDLESWDENECPLCRTGVPINTQVGKGREYLARKDQSQG